MINVFETTEKCFYFVYRGNYIKFTNRYKEIHSEPIHPWLCNPFGAPTHRADFIFTSSGDVLKYRDKAYLPIIKNFLIDLSNRRTTKHLHLADSLNEVATIMNELDNIIASVEEYDTFVKQKRFGD